MSTKFISNFLKIALIFMAMFVGLFGIIVLPMVAEYFATIFPTAVFIKIPMLIVAEILLAIVFSIIIFVIKCVVYFDRKEVFSSRFVKTLKIISVLSLLLFISFLGLYALSTFVMKHITLTVLIILAGLASLIISSLMRLIANVITDAIVLKTDNELTI